MRRLERRRSVKSSSTTPVDCSSQRSPRSPIVSYFFPSKKDPLCPAKQTGQLCKELTRSNSNGSSASLGSKSSSVESVLKRSSKTSTSRHDDPNDSAETMPVLVSMNLGMCEGGSLAGSSRRKTSQRAKDALTRDNSGRSAISNVSALTSNSNISILSGTSSVGSGKSVVHSFTPNSSSFDPSAAAEASRRRFKASQALSSGADPVFWPLPTKNNKAETETSNNNYNAKIMISHPHCVLNHVVNIIPFSETKVEATAEAAVKTTEETIVETTVESSYKQHQRSASAATPHQLSDSHNRITFSEVQVFEKHDIYNRISSVEGPAQSQTTHNTADSIPSHNNSSSKRSMSPIVSARDRIQSARSFWVAKAAAGDTAQSRCKDSTLDYKRNNSFRDNDVTVLEKNS